MEGPAQLLSFVWIFSRVTRHELVCWLLLCRRLLLSWLLLNRCYRLLHLQEMVMLECVLEAPPAQGFGLDGDGTGRSHGIDLSEIR